MEKRTIVFFAFSALVTSLLGVTSAQALDEGNGVPDIPGGLIPDDDTVGPVANVDAAYKFDDGFYQKISSLSLEAPQDGDYGVYDGMRYYDTIIIVSRDDGDDRDPDETARENKDSIVRYLEEMGARSIDPALSLSFVTASVPVADIPGFSLHEEVFALGDGELPVTVAVDTARQTIHATQNDLRATLNRVPTGAGVTVAVVDTGINHPNINNRVVGEISCIDGVCTEGNNDAAVVGRNHTHFGGNPGANDRWNSTYYDQVFASHGTRVAQVIAASGLPANNGISPGVSLLDAMFLEGHSRQHAAAHAIDWSYHNGADVVNLSFGVGPCTGGGGSITLIVNEAVDKGMVAVKSAGNEGHSRSQNTDVADYTSISNPGCAHNVITVGGINDRSPSTTSTMYVHSSRGPSNSTDPRMLPHIVAPAHDIALLGYSTNSSFVNGSGTSYAAPQVSAVAAMMLQLEPELTPAEVKAALLLGADWRGPAQCTSSQYERNNPGDNCSFAMQDDNFANANSAASLARLNNAGFGILNAAESLGIVHSSARNVMSGHLDSDTTSRQYNITVTNAPEPAKVILVWLAHPHGGIADQSRRGIEVPVANLDMSIRTPQGAVISAASAHQSPEFAVFAPPVNGTYTVTVSGSGPELAALNKPVQTFAIASTSALAEASTTPNRPPVAQSDTVVVGPGIGTTIRLHASDADGDAVSFRVFDPANGIVTTDELLSHNTSRVVYVPNSDFSGTDGFWIRPHDGKAFGSYRYITLSQESLPPGSSEAAPRSHDVRDWDSLVPTSASERGSLSKTDAGRSYPVSALHVGSANMEGLSMTLLTTQGTAYRVAVPESGTRMLEFSSPITVRSVTMSADDIDDGAINYANGGLLEDVRMFVGYVPSSCAASSSSGGGGIAGASSSCPAQATYRAVTSPGLPIPDDTDAQSAASTIRVPVGGTLESISVPVDITHSWRGDLRVVLTAPDGRQVVLHDRSGGSADHIRSTYASSSHTGLAGLAGLNITGDWTLSAGDYVRGVSGVLNAWTLELAYRPTASATAPPPSLPTPSQTTVFSDDFESATFTGNWVESGEGDWRLSTSSAHSAPTAPGRPSTNKVMHVDDCDSTCTITLKNPLDLSGYGSATLSFSRFVDYGLDAGEYLKVDLYNGSSWRTIYHWTHGSGDDNRWHTESYDLSSYLVSGFKVRFVAHMSYFNEDVQLDDVAINATSRSGTPVPPPAPPTAATRSIYIADTDDREILAYSLDGTSEGTPVPSRSAGLGKPWDVAFGPDGHMYVSDNTYSKIRKYNGATGAPIGTNAIWASTTGYPYGLEWNGNTLYVATSSGIERFSSSGASLGYFGDAHRSPSTPNAVTLLNAYDMEFCGGDGRMYVADRSSNKVLYYSSSTGAYLGAISGTASSPPNTYRAAGVACGTAITGAGTSLYQSGDDGGRVNEINPATGALKAQYTALIDEPYGLDMDRSGSLYVVNKDDDNVVRITSSGTASVLITGGLDDPRGIAIGPRYSSSGGASGDSADAPGASTSNDPPEVTVLRDGVGLTSVISIPQNSTVSLAVVAADAENDTITLGIIRDMLPDNAISMTPPATGPDGTVSATVSISSAGLEPAPYVFWIEVSDDSDNHEREPYTVRVVPK